MNLLRLLALFQPARMPRFVLASPYLEILVFILILPHFDIPGSEYNILPVSLLKTYTPPFSCPVAMNLPSRLMSMHIPKLPCVSYSLIFCLFASRSHILILPSTVVLARNCPSSLRAMAHISPAVLPSMILPCSTHSPDSEILHILASPPNPTLAALRPFREAAMW